MPLNTIDEVKTFLQITDTDSDLFISAYSSSADDYVINWTHLTEDSASQYNNLKLASAMVVNFYLHQPSNVVSEVVRDKQINYSMKIPDYIHQLMRPQRKARFTQVSSSLYYPYDDIIEDFFIDNTPIEL